MNVKTSWVEGNMNGCSVIRIVIDSRGLEKEQEEYLDSFTRFFTKLGT